jgi:hypothetical protein
MNAQTVSQSLVFSRGGAQRINPWIIKKSLIFGPNSKNWNSWFVTTPSEFCQKKRFQPAVVKTTGEPSTPNPPAVWAKKHRSLYRDSENANDSVTMRGQQMIRNWVQPQPYITLSLANSGIHCLEFGKLRAHNSTVSS